MTPVAESWIGAVAATATVPVLFGKVIVCAAFGSVMVKVVLLASTVAPSKTSGEAPESATTSPAVTGLSVVPVRFHQPWLPEVAVLVMLPEQVRLPVAPSKVQPVAPEPPATLT